MTGFVRHAYRPFDNRWLYYEEETKLLHEKSPYYPPHVFEGNLWLVAQRRSSQEWSPGPVTSHIAGKKLLDFAACGFPLWLRDDGLDGGGEQRRPNLSDAAQRYLDRLGLGVEDLFHHVLAVLHNPSYREDNAGALRMEWPRIPLPGWAGQRRPRSGGRVGRHPRREVRDLAALLDSETPVARRHDRRAAAGDGRNRRSLHHGRRQHGRRRLLGYGRAGDTSGRGRPSCRARAASSSARTPRRSGPRWASPLTRARQHHLRHQPQRTAPTGETSRRRSGATSWADTRSSRSGSPTASAASLGRPLRPEEVQHFTDTARRIAGILGLVGEG